MSSLLPKELWALNAIDWSPSNLASAQPNAVQAYESYLRASCSRLSRVGRPSADLLSGAYIFPTVVAKPSIWQYYKADPIAPNVPITEKIVSRIPEHAPVCALTAVLNHDRIALVGSPGAGTSTFLRWLALQTMEPNVTYNKVPILIELDTLLGQDIHQHIVARFAACGFSKPERCAVELLDKGGCLLLFDGLDEACSSSKVRETLLAKVIAYIAQYPANKVVITNRATLVDYDLEEFTYYAMSHFTAEQVKTYVTQWFDGQSEQANALSAELIDTCHPRLKALVDVPLTLSMLCLVYAETGKIPTERWQLYKFVADIHFKYHRNTQPLQNETRLSVTQKRQLLTEVAMHTFDKGQRLIEKDCILEIIQHYLSTLSSADGYDANLVLQDLVRQPRLLQEVHPGYYAFQHLTFHEYFVARHIVSDGTGERAIQLILHQSSCRMWREVVLLTVEQLARADAFFEIFSQKLISIATEAELTSLFLDNARIANSRQLREHWRVITCRALAVRMISYLARLFSLTAALETSRLLAHSLNLPIEKTIASLWKYDLDTMRAKVLSNLLVTTDQLPTETVERAAVLLKARALDEDMARSVSTVQTMDWAFELGQDNRITEGRQQAEFISALNCLLMALIYSDEDDVKPLVKQLLMEALDAEDIDLPGINWREQYQRILLMKWQGDLRSTVGKALVDLNDDILNLGMPVDIDWSQMNRYFQLAELYLSSLRVATVSGQQQWVSTLLFPISS